MVFLEALSLFLNFASPFVWIMIIMIVGFVGVILAVTRKGSKKRLVTWDEDEFFPSAGDKPRREKQWEDTSWKTQSLEEYEDEYLARQGIESTSRKPTARRKPAETRESESNFCDNCGKSLRPTAKFCSGCGTPRS